MNATSFYLSAHKQIEYTRLDFCEIMAPMNDLQEIFLIVGKKVRPAQARIVGGIAKVPSPHGTLEFSRWFDTSRKAKLAIAKKRKAA